MAPGIAWSAIAEKLEHGARERGYGIVTAYMGHGIGRDLHEAPAVPTPSFRSGAGTTTSRSCPA